jgi:hypothetical protein
MQPGPAGARSKVKGESASLVGAPASTGAYRTQLQGAHLQSTASSRAQDVSASPLDRLTSHALAVATQSLLSAPASITFSTYNTQLMARALDQRGRPV